MSIKQQKHDLFWDLEAFDPHWQLHYKTLRAAAVAAKVLTMMSDWLTTDEGRRYQELHTDVPDTLEQNLAEQKLRERLNNGIFSE